MAFRKVLNVVLLAVAMVFLCGTVGLKALDELGVGLPDSWEVGKARSSLEGRSYAKRPSPSVANLTSGKFQDQVEKYASDIVPMRDTVLLANAAMQRSVIRVANAPFGFEAYPAFFGSGTSIDPDNRLIFPTVAAPNSNGNRTATAFAKLVNELATKYPDTRFVFDAIRTPHTSEYNPTYQYKSTTFPKDWNEDYVFKELTAPNIAVLDDPISSFDEFKSEWITTEHHWTLKRALRSYNLIAQQLDLMTFKYENPTLVSHEWYGARSRLGRNLEYSSDFYDVLTDFSQIQWLDKKGKPTTYGQRDEFLAGKNPYSTSPVFNVYDTYYGSLDVDAVNHGQSNGKKCLVVCVSYMRALKGYIAANYERTVFVAPTLHPTDKPLSDYLAEGFDDVIIQLDVASYGGIGSRSAGLLR